MIIYMSKSDDISILKLIYQDMIDSKSDEPFDDYGYKENDSCRDFDREDEYAFDEKYREDRDRYEAYIEKLEEIGA